MLYGGRLVVVPYWVSRSPEALYELLVGERVTVLNQTPGAFRQLMAAAVAGSRELALKWVVFGGEALQMESLGPWWERFGEEGPALVNMYGITETTVHVTYRRLGRKDLEGRAASVIGGPLPDLEMYMLDGYGEPVPLGVAGELYIGGAGLARGYLERAGADGGAVRAGPVQRARRGRGCTGPETWRGGGATGKWSIWGARTSR